MTQHRESTDWINISWHLMAKVQPLPAFAQDPWRPQSESSTSSHTWRKYARGGNYVSSRSWPGSQMSQFCQMTAVHHIAPCIQKHNCPWPVRDIFFWLGPGASWETQALSEYIMYVHQVFVNTKRAEPSPCLRKCFSQRTYRALGFC